MIPLDPSTLRPGQRLPKAIFTRQGVKLVSAGIRVTRPMLAALRDQARLGQTTVEGTNLVLADGPPSRDATAPRRRPTRDLVQDPEATTTDPHGRAARRRRAKQMRVADERIAELLSVWRQSAHRIQPVASPLDLSARDTPGWPEPERLLATRAERTELLRGAMTRCLAGETVVIGDLRRIVDECVELLARHPERYAQIALLAPHQPEYLADHAYTTAALAVAIAARLRWSAEHVRMAGLAGLLADLGMLLVPEDARYAPRSLTDVEVNRVWRHPTLSVMLAQHVDGLPDPVRRAIYEHHERENGGGYPQRLRGPMISDLAKVVAVADAFAAAIEPRAYRAPKRAYEALEELVMLGAQRVFDRRAVRALVESTGLFPVGSHVHLSSGEIGLVVGSHPAKVDRPIVRVYQRIRGEPILGPQLDLTDFEPWALHVIRPADPPGRPAEHREPAPAAASSAA